MTEEFMPVDEPFTTARIDPNEMKRKLLQTRVGAHIPKRPPNSWDPKNTPNRFTHRDIYD